LEVEDGFPCAHRRLKFYVLREGKMVTWKELHEEYKVFVDKEKEGINIRDMGIKTMALSTFREYRIWLFPGYSLSRRKEDECDHCIHLQLIISNPLSSVSERDQARMELDMHNEAAVEQRRAIKKFTLRYMSSLNLPVQPVHVPDFIDGEDNGETEEFEAGIEHIEQQEREQVGIVNTPFSTYLQGIDTLVSVVDGEYLPVNEDETHREYSALVIAEDYGQSVALPHFGFRRPSADYFNSNLMVHLFVMADISRKQNKIMMYDEQCMGKEKDAL
jgi:hypothetical protein